MKVHTVKSLFTGIIAICLFSLLSFGSSAGGLAAIRKQPSNELPNKTFFSSLATLRPLSSILMADGPTVTTDKLDYPIGATVVIGGSGWQPGETVTLQVTDNLSPTDPNEVAHAPWDVVADADGNISSTWIVDEDADNLTLTLTAHGNSSGLDALTNFTDANPSARLDQCANDPAPSPSSDGCSAAASDWVNGNLGASKSLYQEGDSIPYRLSFDNLSLASHTVTIEWDTTKAGHHAIDYLTTVTQSVLTADPCLGVSGCNAFTTFAIPADPQVTGAGVTPISGNFRFYGGTITSVSAYSYADGTGFAGDKSARITITFTPTVANPVLAWGGHISTRTNWGLDGSAVAIPGSPYHTRLIDLDGSGGNQDRSLSADAVIFPGSITIIKDAVPNGPTNFAFTASPSPLSGFSLDDDSDPALSNTKLFSNITTFTTYTVTETQVNGWVLSPISCSVTSANGGSQNVTIPSVAINLKEGENVTCTFVNTEDQNLTRGRIKVAKVTNPNPDPTDSSFQIAPDYEGSFFLKNLEDHTSGNLLPSDDDSHPTYSVSETIIPAGWEQVSATCDHGTPGNITVLANTTTICTFTNRLKPTLTLKKHVINDNGGTADASAWTLSATATAPAGNVSGFSGTGTPATGIDATVGPNIVDVGSYTLGESGGPSGYSASQYSCVINGGTPVISNSITLAAGNNAVCTITNDDNAPKLHLRKVVVNDNGGAATVADFTLTANGTGTNDLTGTSPVDSGATLKADTFALSETNVTGYTASDWVCVGGTQGDATHITVGLGGEATCTITNNDIPPQLYLRKIVTNDNGGTATVTDFPLTANGTGANDLTGTSPVDSGAGLLADTWALSETGPAGYTASAWVCVGGNQVGSNITVGVGGSATCTITNNDIPPQLHLRKLVTNDNGGTALITNWTLTGDGAGSNDVSGTTPVDSTSGLLADTFTLSESGPSGYTASTWTCVGGTYTNVAGVEKVQVGIGGSATCTITNDDRPPILHLRKVVTNDNGGTGTVADFTLTADGATTNDLSGTSPVDSGVGLKADTFALSEAVSAAQTGKYTASAWVCIGGQQAGSNITLGNGDEATCTITNNDKPPILHLRKVVTNDNGGTGTVADFTLTADGATTNDLSGTSPVDSGVGLKADTFALSEAVSAAQTGKYTASAWVCIGGQQAGSNITLGNGDEATCTITNDDNAPALHLRKVVVNDNGGTKTVADFTLTADGSGTNDLSGTSPVDSGATLKADTFALSETGVTGYTASDWVCVGGTQGDATHITVGLGQSATCTITNDDNAPALHLRKVVVNDNGGTKTVADFTLTADGSGTNDLSGTSPVDSGATLKADTFALSETGVTGYTASDWVCVGGTQGDATHITVGLGQSATCTITNDDNAPALHLRKVVVNDNGGTKTVADFTLTADGSGTNDLSGSSPVDSGATLKADTFALSETGAAGYSASAWICVGGTQNGSNITIGLGGEATCTITNDDVQPHLTLVKSVTNNNGGTAGPNVFGISVGGAGVTSGVRNAYNANTPLAINETGLAGYTFVSITGNAKCPSALGGTVTLAPTDDITCTITNDDQPGTLIVKKVVINDNGGTKVATDFKFKVNGGTATSFLQDGGDASKGKNTLTVNASIYNVLEDATPIAGYTTTYDNCSNVVVVNGGSQTCTITNDDQPGTIVIRKITKPVNTGSFGFTATGSGYNGFTLSGGGQNSQTLNAGTYTVKEGTQLGWVLTGIGGSTDPTTPYNCVVTGSGGSTGSGNLNTQTATISLKSGDTVTCTFENTGSGATRTQGFWATHSPLANIAWFGGTAFGHTFPGVAGVNGIGDAALCGRPIDTLGKLMGGFWSDISKTSTGKKRSALDQARMQLLQQLLSAELNASAFGSLPSGGSGQFAVWEAAYCGTNQTAIQNALQGAASFNNSGDSTTFTPGTSADSKNARAIANYVFWNVLP